MLLTLASRTGLTVPVLIRCQLVLSRELAAQAPGPEEAAELERAVQHAEQALKEMRLLGACTSRVMKRRGIGG